MTARYNKTIARRGVATISIFAAVAMATSAVFGGNWKLPTRSGEIMTIECTTNTIPVGGIANCYVTRSSGGSMKIGSTTGANHFGKSGRTHFGGNEQVEIYSDPVGAVSYSGSLDSNTATLPATVAANAPTGPVTVYVQTADGGLASTTTTITSD